MQLTGCRAREWVVFCTLKAIIETQCSMNFTSHHFNLINISRVNSTLDTLWIVSKTHMMYEGYLWLIFTPEADVQLFRREYVLWKFLGNHLCSPVLIYEEKSCLLGWARWEEGETCFVCKPHCCDCSLISAVSRQHQSMCRQWPTPSESVVNCDPHICMPISQCIFFFFKVNSIYITRRATLILDSFVSLQHFPLKRKSTTGVQPKHRCSPKNHMHVLISCHYNTVNKHTQTKTGGL